MGYKALSNFEIERKCKALFGGKFYRCLSVDSPVPSRDCYFIINTDKSTGKGDHWVAGIRKAKTIYLYDSYGRYASRILQAFIKNIKKKRMTVKNADISDSDQRGNTSASCGHRCISALQIANKYGIRAFLKL